MNDLAAPLSGDTPRNSSPPAYGLAMNVAGLKGVERASESYRWATGQLRATDYVELARDDRREVVWCSAACRGKAPSRRSERLARLVVCDSWFRKSAVDNRGDISHFSDVGAQRQHLRGTQELASSPPPTLSAQGNTARLLLHGCAGHRLVCADQRATPGAVQAGSYCRRSWRCTVRPLATAREQLWFS